MGDPFSCLKALLYSLSSLKPLRHESSGKRKRGFVESSSPNGDKYIYLLKKMCFVVLITNLLAKLLLFIIMSCS